MRTTIRIEDALLKEAKQRALERDMSLTALIEEALRVALTPRPVEPARQITFPITHGSGPAPGLDIDDNSAVLDWLDRHDG